MWVTQWLGNSMSRRADPRVDRQDGSARAKGYARSAAVASNAVRRLTEPLWGPTYRTFWNDGAWMGRRQCSGFTGTQYTFFSEVVHLFFRKYSFGVGVNSGQLREQRAVACTRRVRACYLLCVLSDWYSYCDYSYGFTVCYQTG